MDAIRKFLSMQLDAAEKETDATGQGLYMILMADYLLEELQKRPEVFQQAEEHSLRKLFLRLGSAEERVKKLYENYHEPLSESAERILKKIEENMNLIAGKQSEIAAYDKAVLELEETIGTKEELLKREKALLDRKAEIEKLLENIEKLKAELVALEEQNQSYVKDAEELSALIVKEGEKYEELKAEFEENERLKEGLFDTKFFDPEDFKKHLDAVRNRGDELVKDYEDTLGNVLKDARALYKKIMERHHL